MLNTRSLVNRVNYKKMLDGGLDLGTRWALCTVNMFNEDNKLSIVLLVDMVTWSLTQCGQRQLPPSMLCSLLCPPCIVSIKNAIYLYISVYLILPTALMESIAGCLPILATAHGLSLPHAMCKAVNPWSSCTICSSSCVFVHKCAFWQNFAHFIQRRGVGFDL